MDPLQPYREAARDSPSNNPQASFNIKFLALKQEAVPTPAVQKPKVRTPIRGRGVAAAKKPADTPAFVMPEFSIETSVKTPVIKEVQVPTLQISLKNYDLQRIVEDYPTKEQESKNEGPYTNEKLRDVLLKIKTDIRKTNPVLAETIPTIGMKRDLMVKSIHNMVSKYNIPIGSSAGTFLDFTDRIDYSRISEAPSRGKRGPYPAAELINILEKIRVALNAEYPGERPGDAIITTGAKKDLVSRIKNLLDTYNIKTS